ncbi:MAG: CBS domain-containing protein [Peptococcaceae bacterium]|nr:CBS domain-containing protein [Peptococcaceae bacterium]
MQAKDIMTSDVITVREDTTIDEVSRLFVEKHISGLPVVNQYDKLVGVISEGDLMYKHKPVKPPTFINLFDGLFPVDRKEFQEDMKRIAAHEVRDLMTKPPIYAYEDTSIGELATLIVEKKVNRIPIVNEIMEVVGLVSRHDLVRSMIASDQNEEA